MRRLAPAVLSVLFLTTAVAAQQAKRAPAYDDVLAYVHKSWDTLTRRMDTCATVIDPKVPNKSILYVPRDMEIPAAVAALESKCKIAVRKLPLRAGDPAFASTATIAPGLLYLPNPYVVPGGRFNEMYGWDSYFIIIGLIEDGRIDLARGMVDNFVFEVEHYGAVLNANRSYYLTRSQPPFLTSMITAVWQADKKRGRGSNEWLRRAYIAAQKDYERWIREPHLAGTTGLSRYFDLGEGPVPEETATYNDVARWLVSNLNTSLFEQVTDPSYPWPTFTLSLCPEQGADGAGASPLQNQKRCGQVRVGLTAEYYKGDRSMRESGFDISFRFGPFGSRTHHFAPVCLNSLLYKTEVDLQQIATALGDVAGARGFAAAAAKRKELMQKLWDAQRGMFFDFDVAANKRSTYEFAATFYPLWVGLATDEQARAVARNLGVFESAGGIATSPYHTGVQWDFPYGWAPLQLIAVEGLRRYGFNAEADRIASKWTSMVVENFRREGTIREKYNVMTRTTEAQVTAGYSENVVGFGWTNGVFVRLLQR